MALSFTAKRLLVQRSAPISSPSLVRSTFARQCPTLQKRFATKKAGGSSNNGQGPGTAGKRRGLKAWGGESTRAGCILVRQLDNKYNAGRHVRQGRDFTLYAEVDGKIRFTYEWQTKKVS